MAVRINATLFNLGDFIVKVFSFEGFDDNIAKIIEQYHSMEEHVEEMQQTLNEWNKDKEIQELKKRIKWIYDHSLVTNLSNKELADIKEFKEQHYKTCCGNGKYKSKGNKWIYTISGTGIGHIIEITCPECGQSADVTDIDNW